MLKSLVKSVIISLSTVASIYAAPVHTWHHIKSLTGNWAGRLVITSANENAYFTDKDGHKVGQLYNFSLNAQTPFLFGFGFSNPTDFNVSYVLTLYQVDSQHTMFSSKACQFDISAKAPAEPDIRVESYNGAKCKYKITTTGEDYKVG